MDNKLLKWVGWAREIYTDVTGSNHCTKEVFDSIQKAYYNIDDIEDRNYELDFRECVEKHTNYIWIQEEQD